MTMFNRNNLITAIIAGLLIALMMALPVDAQQAPRNCAPREAVLERLAEGYGETRQTIALDTNNSVVEQFANNDTGTWTLTVTMPNGMTCLVASGQAFEHVTETLEPTGEKL